MTKPVRSTVPNTVLCSIVGGLLLAGASSPMLVRADECSYDCVYEAPVVGVPDYVTPDEEPYPQEPVFEPTPTATPTVKPVPEVVQVSPTSVAPSPATGQPATPDRLAETGPDPFQYLGVLAVAFGTVGAGFALKRGYWKKAGK